MMIIRLILKTIFYVFVKLISIIISPYIKLRNVIQPDGRLRVLVYHGIGHISEESEKDEWTVSPELFEAQMQYLSVNKYSIISIDAAIKYLSTGKPFPPKSVSITFDDGYLNNYTNAFRIMKRYGFTATVYLVTEYIGSEKPFVWKIKPGISLKEEERRNYKSLNWFQIKEMAEQGMTFGSHSHTHPNISHAGNAYISREVSESKSELLSNLKSADITFACPFGIHGSRKKQLVEILKRYGYAGAFLGSYGAVNPKTDSFDMPRISIYGDDSLSVFIRKSSGAFDWLSSLYSVWQLFWALTEYRFGAPRYENNDQ